MLCKTPLFRVEPRAMGRKWRYAVRLQSSSEERVRALYGTPTRIEDKVISFSGKVGNIPTSDLKFREITRVLRGPMAAVSATARLIGRGREPRWPKELITVDRVIVYRSEILPAAETFILAQVRALRRFEPHLIGIRPVTGLALDGLPVELLERVPDPGIGVSLCRVLAAAGQGWAKVRRGADSCSFRDRWGGVSASGGEAESAAAGNAARLRCDHHG